MMHSLETAKLGPGHSTAQGVPGPGGGPGEASLQADPGHFQVSSGDMKSLCLSYFNNYQAQQQDRGPVTDDYLK